MNAFLVICIGLLLLIDFGDDFLERWIGNGDIDDIPLLGQPGHDIPHFGLARVELQLRAVASCLIVSAPGIAKSG